MKYPNDNFSPSLPFFFIPFLFRLVRGHHWLIVLSFWLLLLLSDALTFIYLIMNEERCCSLFRQSRSMMVYCCHCCCCCCSCFTCAAAISTHLAKTSKPNEKRPNKVHLCILKIVFEYHLIYKTLCIQRYRPLFVFFVYSSIYNILTDFWMNAKGWKIKLRGTYCSLPCILQLCICIRYRLCRCRRSRKLNMSFFYLYICVFLCHWGPKRWIILPFHFWQYYFLWIIYTYRHKQAPYIYCYTYSRWLIFT